MINSCAKITVRHLSRRSFITTFNMGTKYERQIILKPHRQINRQSPYVKSPLICIICSMPKVPHNTDICTLFIARSMTTILMRFHNRSGKTPSKEESIFDGIIGLKCYLLWFPIVAVTFVGISVGYASRVVRKPSRRSHNHHLVPCWSYVKGFEKPEKHHIPNTVDLYHPVHMFCSSHFVLCYVITTAEALASKYKK